MLDADIFDFFGIFEGGEPQGEVWFTLANPEEDTTFDVVSEAFDAGGNCNVVGGGGGIDLADITAGGDGTGTGTNAAVDPDLGTFVTLQEVLDGADVDPFWIYTGSTNGQNPVAVDSPYIESVFLIDAEEIAINLSGVTYNFGIDNLDDEGRTWGPILANFTPNILETGGADQTVNRRFRRQPTGLREGCLWPHGERHHLRPRRDTRDAWR